MNTQHHDTIKTTPYEVVFGIKPSSEPVSALTVIEDEKAQDAGSEGDSSEMEGNNDNNSEGKKTCMQLLIHAS